MQLIGRRYDDGQPVCVELDGPRIASINVGPATEPGKLPWIAPGLVDLQVNGYGGHQFTDPALTAEQVERISVALDRDGVTSYLPTVITQSADVLMHAVSTIRGAIDESQQVRRRVAGIHLEGPYISPHDGPRGAHPREHCRPPDWDEFQRLQDASGGNIRIVTLSPEYLEAPEFIDLTVSSGVAVSIGHTAANSAQIQAAVDAGATMSTHLGNGAHVQLRRHPNYIWDQLAEDRLTATLIVDGHHLSPEVVKCFVRAKGTERIALISDITGIAGVVGTEPGYYEKTGLGAVEVLLDGRVVVAGQRDYLAGATRPLSAGVAQVIAFADVDLAAAVDMASARPARLIGLPAGRLAPDAPANLIQFELPAGAQNLEVRATVNHGQCVFGTPLCAENVT